MAEEKGYQIDSPRTAIATGFKMGFIGDEQSWVQMLKDRNETSHIYNESVAKGIYQRAVAHYLPEFLAAAKKLESKP